MVVGINDRTRLFWDLPRESQPAKCSDLQPSRIETSECGSRRIGFRELLPPLGFRALHAKIRADVVGFRLRKIRRALREYRYLGCERGDTCRLTQTCPHRLGNPRLMPRPEQRSSKLHRRERRI